MKTTDPRAEVAEPYRHLLALKLDTLAAVATAAEEQSWSSLGWPADSCAPDFGDRGDAIVVMREDLRDLHHAPYVPVRAITLDFDPVRVAMQMLGFARPETDCLNAPDPKYYRRHLEQLSRARLALIVVTHDLRLPRLEGAASFETGRVDGAALLFELASRELRGGFELHVENSWQVKGNDETITDKLRRELEAKFSNAVIAGIAGRFPQGRAPVTLGYY